MYFIGTCESFDMDMSWFPYAEQSLTGTWSRGDDTYNSNDYYTHNEQDLYMFNTGGYWRVQDTLGGSGSFLNIRSTGTCPAGELGSFTFWDETNSVNVEIGTELLFKRIGKNL